MTSQAHDYSHDPAEFAQNIAKVAEKCQQIMQEFMGHQGTQDVTKMPFDPLNVSGAFMELFTRLAGDPLGLMEKQFGLWQDYMHLWQKTAQRAIGDEQPPVIRPDSKDRRFRDEAWEQNAVFDFLKQSYLLSARWMQNSVNDVEGMDPKIARKIDFYTRQFVDAMSPSNFW